MPETHSHGHRHAQIGARRYGVELGLEFRAEAQLKLFCDDCEECADDNDEGEYRDPVNADCCDDNVGYEIDKALPSLRQDGDTGRRLAGQPIVHDKPGCQRPVFIWDQSRPRNCEIA